MGERTVTSGGAVLRELIAEGVSPWLDGLCRSSLTSGLLARLVTSGAVRGAVFEPAALARDLTGTTAYHQQLAHLACRSVPLETAVHALCAYDLRSACDELRPVFEATDGLDGQVSMDLDPALAHDAPATVAAAAELHRAACRPNALVKIPATDEGLAAIVECLGRGIGVHVTEVFSVRRYGQVVDAYFEGLERALEKGLDLSSVSSLVSLSVGRIDAEADSRLAELGGRAAPALHGTAALATARLVYRLYEERLGCPRWRALTARRARPQRLVWDVGTPPVPGDPRPVRYVETLVAWGTVIAMPAAVLDEAGRSGRLQGDTLTGEHRAARAAVDRLEGLGVLLDEVAKKLEAESMDHLVASWRELRSAVGERLRTAG
ncbi:hypothetical protein VR41_11895 [Streptomyces sp. NRRL B-1568]|nr:hypothetical protein VR41_11895 [Streptomyces sp. NRRL B-1568]